MSRPERTAAAQAFYDPAEAAKYSASARMGRTQRHLAERALHLLDIRQPGALLLDFGCGTGYSGAPLERAGHAWVGLDLSESMLRAARAPGKRRDVLCADLGAPLWLRRRVFDGAVSISAVQWLCHATANGHDPAKRVRTFFRGLKAVLVPGARAVLQLYPEQPEHMGEREGRARGERGASERGAHRGPPGAARETAARAWEDRPEPPPLPLRRRAGMLRDAAVAAGFSGAVLSREVPHWRHGRTLLASRPRHARRRLPALRAVKEALPCADVAEPGGGGGGREEARSGVGRRRRRREGGRGSGQAPERGGCTRGRRRRKAAASGGGRRWRREAERREVRVASESEKNRKSECFWVLRARLLVSSSRSLSGAVFYYFSLRLRH